MWLNAKRLLIPFSGMSKNFTLKELTFSATAERDGIDNTPSPEVVGHINELCDNLLQPLRDAWGKPIRVTSGYRCPELNKKVGGSMTSAHLCGYAADLQSGDFLEFTRFVVAWLQDKAYDQCIIERNGTAEWLHLGYKDGQGRQRHQTKTINKN